MYNKLLHGKGQVDRIVSIEVENEVAWLIRQEEDGTLDWKPVQNKFWILCNEQVNSKWVKLKGDLYYKYGIQYEDRTDFVDSRRRLKNLSYDIYSIYDQQEALMVKDGYTYYHDLKHDEIPILAFDIETTTLELNDNAKLLLIANTFRDEQGKITRKLFCYDDYENEGELIEDWCKWVCLMNPSIVCGHNIYTFDIPYLNFIAKKYDKKLLLGRDGSEIKLASYESQFRKDGSQSYSYKKCRIWGRELCDTMFLAIKYDIATRKYESYGLKNIIKQEGLEKEGRVFYDASQIRYKYQIPEEWKQIKEYASFDGDDALSLYDLMIPPFFYSARNIPKTMQAIIESASGSQLNAIMMRAYLQDGHSLPKESLTYQFEGAISFGHTGIYHNVMKVDVASLYPSVMLEYEICDTQKDPCRYLLELLRTFRDERLKNKQLAKETGDKFYKHLEQSQKIFINSLYGFMGAPGLLFNFPKGAEEVTRHGREILTKAINWAHEWDFLVTNGDTDSISFCKKDMSKFGELEQNYYLEDLNKEFPVNIKWEHDGLYKNFAIVGAKNYVLEGFDGKRKLKGSALTAKTREPRLLDFINDFIELLLSDKKDLIPDMYNYYVKEIMNLESIDGWCSKKTITKSVLNPERTNEQKVLDAIQGVEGIQEGDKKWFFFKPDGTLCLQENFDGTYCKNTLLKKIYKTALIFQDVYDTKNKLPNYSLKKNSKLLEELIK